MECVDTGAVWLGQPGRLVRLPDPSPGVETIRAREISIHVGVHGGRTVDVTGSGLRTFSYSYSRLTQAECDIIDEFHSGSQGRGPFALLDPVYVNRFTPNQASGGTVCNDAAGFDAIDYDASVVIDRTETFRGPTAIGWGYQPRGLRRLDLPSPWPALGDGARAFPVLPGARVHLRAMARPDTDTWIGWTPAYYDHCGNPLPSHDPDPMTARAGTWQAVTATVAPPAGAAWIAPRLGAVTPVPRPYQPAYVRLDSLSMVYGDTRSEAGVYHPGNGVPQVEITKFTQTIPHIGHVDATLELTEVCA